MNQPTRCSVTSFSQSFNLQGKDKAENISVPCVLGDGLPAGDTLHWDWRQEELRQGGVSCARD